MRKKITYIIVVAVLSLVYTQTHAQLAKQENLTFKTIQDRVNGLLKREDPQSKDSIRWEAMHLVNAKSEDYIRHGMSLYGFLDDTKAKEEAHRKLLKQFPKSSYTANVRLDELLTDYMDYETFQKHFKAWSKQYKDRISTPEFADGAYNKVANKLLRAGEVSAAITYSDKITGSSKKLDFLYNLAQHYYDQGEFKQSESVLTAIINDHTSALGQQGYQKSRIYTLYSQLLGKQQSWDKALEYIQQYNLNLADLKFQALIGLDKPFDAFLFLDSVFTRRGLPQELENEAPALFRKLGSTPEQWLAYKNRVEQKKLDDKKQYWKSAMIDQDAIDFELQDMQGNTVRLSDYKGKILILDFWATWCGPCKASFPGMQEAIRQFKDDEQVAFLFINTWERGDDYKEKVKAFIAQEGYDFHVVYDHMSGSDALVSKYGITGIPTKIIIDTNGRVRFNSSGSSSVIKEVVDEISYKIELIRKLNIN